MSQTVTNRNKFARIGAILRQSLRGEERDYTEGSIREAIVLLAIPMILELSLESVFAVVDMYFVGELGKNAIQTVGLTESVISLVYAVAIGQREDREKARIWEFGEFGNLMSENREPYFRSIGAGYG